MKKLIFTFLLTVASLICASLLLSCGEEYSDGLNFVLLEDGTYGVRCGRVTSSETVIPKERYGIPVTTVLDNFFSEDIIKYGSVTVTIPEGVTSIADEAFFGRGKKCTVIIPSTVRTIGEFAFCNSGVDAVFSEGSQLEVIGKSAFSNSGITSFTAPSGLHTVGEGAFAACKQLTFVDLSPASGLKKIPSGCFASSAMREVILNEGLETVGDNAFGHCVFDSIRLPSNVKTVEQEAFSYCRKLKNVELPIDGGLETICSSTFKACISLRSIILPKNMKELSSGAFYECNNLVEIYDLSDHVRDRDLTEEYLGVKGSGILAIHKSEDEPSVIRRTEDGFLYYLATDSFVLAGYDGAETELVFPEKLEGKAYRIAPYAFAYSAITSAVLPDGLRGIGEAAFQNSELNKVNVPQSVLEIGKRAFKAPWATPEFEGEGEWKVGYEVISNQRLNGFSHYYVSYEYSDVVWIRKKS